MVGRKKEIEELNRLYESDESEFIAVYGRRRIGKTYLIRETFADRFAFHHTGLPNASKQKQLAHFKESLNAAGFKGATPTDWFKAFRNL
ncbi:MAG: ATP-binding protein, partial [Lentisphaerae bacterium]|nr:ATP-binding protein [Lentisphaerota bacterium]